MKARVKATGENVSVKVVEIGRDYKGRQIFVYEDDKGRCFADNELDFDNPDNTPEDYWTRLEHQAAIGAMQAYIIASHISQFSFHEGDMKDCKTMAHALVQKLKEKEERK